jgi:hypothetical protein
MDERRQEAKDELNKRGLSRCGVLNILKSVGLGVGAAVFAGGGAVSALPGN